MWITIYKLEIFMLFRRYAQEGGEPVDLSSVRNGCWVEDAIYREAHHGLVLLCHDIFVQYRDGILLVTRDNHPAKGELWPIGGKWETPLTREESVAKKVEEESNLDVDPAEMVMLGGGDTLFRTDPFGHEKGTHTFNFVYFARGEGDLRLDRLHTQPRIVTPREYTQNSDLRSTLPEYVQDFMDIAIPMVE
jgi:ADP-ribose pyrophosphatase YjhB (NUDIX family)